MGGPACVVALGVDVTVWADEDAFAASDASLLGDGDADGDGDGDGDGDEAPAHVVEQGWPWPPRMAAESFISYGVFGEPAQAQAHARLIGTVLGAQRKTVAATGQEFVAARVRTAGFDVDVCLRQTMLGSCRSLATSSLGPCSWSPRYLSRPRRTALQASDPGCRGAADNGHGAGLPHHEWGGNGRR